MGNHQVALHLDDATMRELEQEARWQEQSEADIATQALKAYLDRQAYKRAAIEEAVAEADKGVFISGEAMHRWIESWDSGNELPPPEPDIFLKPRQK